MTPSAPAADRVAGAALWPALCLCFNALVWGLSWWPFRQLQALGLHPLWATVLVYLVAVVMEIIRRWHRNNMVEHHEEVERLLVIARSDDNH